MAMLNNQRVQVCGVLIVAVIFCCKRPVICHTIPFFPWLEVMIDIPFLDVYPNNQFMKPGECVFVWCSPPIFLQVYGYLPKSAPRLPDPPGGCKDYDLGTTSITANLPCLNMGSFLIHGGIPKSMYTIPSGKHTKNYGKWLFLMGKSTS